MKNLLPYSPLVAALALLSLSPSQAQADIFTDPSGDGSLVGTGGGILDITSVEVNNTATDLIFKLNLAGNPVATDWGKYMISLNTAPGGDSSGNGWGRPISMAGMDYWVGSWVDSGNGAEIRNYTGSWGLQSATYLPNPDSLSISKDATSVTLQFKFAGLGLSLGNSFSFDVYTSGGGGTDSAIDALANPSQTVANWGDPYTTQSPLSYTLTQVPEPSVLSLLMGGAALVCGWTMHRQK